MRVKAKPTLTCEVENEVLRRGGEDLQLQIAVLDIEGVEDQVKETGEDSAVLPGRRHRVGIPTIDPY